jgi:hypothetical protein
MRDPVRGLTLVEVLVATALSGFLMLLVVSFSGSDAKMHNRVRVGEFIQSYEVAKIRSFADKAMFERSIGASNDPLLEACRLNPCDTACVKSEAWRPLAYADIPVIPYKVDGQEFFAGGRYTLPLFEKCAPLPPRPEDVGKDPAPRYPPECRVDVRAMWRSGPHGTLEYRIQLKDNSLGITRSINHYESPYDLGQSHDCREERVAAYCKGPGSFLISVDFKEASMICGDPESRVNYP